MADEGKSLVPVWTLTTAGDSRVPSLQGASALTPQRLAEMRSALAAFADFPVVTLEAHPLLTRLDRAGGISLDALSPLARELSRLVTQSAKTSPAAANVAQSGEVLYRMVVPAKVAAQVGKGLVKPMVAKGVPGAVHSALRDSTGIVAQAVFQPVEVAAAGAATGAAGTAAAGAAGAGALTIAAPLVLMAVAVGASAYADQQRQRAIENIAKLLEQLHDEQLEHERSDLDGCRDAIDKATALLLDRGKVGAALGLDSAVHAISKATEMADHRLRRWQGALDKLPDGPVELTSLQNVFRGVGEPGGEFRAHVELAALAIALKRRVIVLQAVEAAQGDLENPFENFVRSLKADQRRVDELEAEIASVLVRLSSLQLRLPNGLIDKVLPRRRVEELLQAVYLLRELGDGIQPGAPASDVVIEIAKHRDGTLHVLPAPAA